jgi:DNA-nicking Smr family endonuclease
MSKKAKPTNSELELFRQAVADVMPLKADARVEFDKPRKRAITSRNRQVLYEPGTSGPQPEAGSNPISSHDGASHRKNGVQLKQMQRLKRGQFPLEDQLDLHHMTVDEARAVLMKFIEQSTERGFRCIRVIHGKGMHSGRAPRLKTSARQLLREHPGVLAFTPCKPSQGGDGATDVLLRLS